MFSIFTARASNPRAHKQSAWLSQAVLYYLSIAACLMLVINLTVMHGAKAAPLTFTVSNANDSGPGSLRQAILDANANAGRDTINFNIPGAGVHTIHLLQQLPFVSDEVVINGYTQPGAQPNTLAEGSNAVLLIELDGSQAGLGANGLIIYYQTEVRGLIINGFKSDPGEGNTGGNGIVITGNNNRVAGCFIGTNAAGTAAVLNEMNGVVVQFQTGFNSIGGHDPADRNVLSGNGANGVVLLDTGCIVENNLIGTNAAGTGAVPNGQHGVLLTGAAIYNGVNADDFTPGFTGNVIAFNGGDGVRVARQGTLIPTSNRITRNCIFNNGGLGIDLEGDGVTPNDPLDMDTGANWRQNYPVITSALLSALPGNQWQVTLVGTLNSSPSQSYSLHFYANLNSDTNSSGRKFLGSLNLDTDASGLASFNPTFTFSGLASTTFKFTATATDEGQLNSNTSEFSPAFTAQSVNGQVQFAQANTTVNEADGLATINVTRINGSTGTVTVDYAASNGTASAPQDFTAVSGTLTFSNGETLKSFSVPVVNDHMMEGSETVTLTLSNPQGGASIGSPNPATLTIQDPLCPTITVAPAGLPNGIVGFAYNTQVTANPASAYSFTLTSGSLPPGLQLNSMNGAISGTPGASGAFGFTITAANIDGCTGVQTYQIVIAPCPVIALSPAPNPANPINPFILPNGITNASYSTQVMANPAGAYSYSVTTNILPPGLTLNSATGVISGTPTAGGNFAFVITANVANGCTASQAYQILILTTCETITINPATLTGGALGTSFNQTMTTTGGAGPYTFTVASGALPLGLALNASTGVLSGVFAQAGTFIFTLKATGAGLCTGTRNYVIVVSCGTLTFTPATLPNGKAGTRYNQTLSVAPTANSTFSLLTGQLPIGLMLSSAGIISGTPTQTGTFNFTVKAQAGSCSATKTYSIVIAAASLAARAQMADYDGDGQADFALFRDGSWNIVRSGDQQTASPSWGATSDVALAGDYDGDGQSDLAIFRPGNGTWFIKRSSDGGALVKAWGARTDVPVPGDYDGDGKTDIAIFRPSEGNWYVSRSSDQQAAVTAWGMAFDVAVPGDYDGDGKTDVAVFRPASGQWFIKQSSNGAFIVKAWGLSTDVPVASDYDGDGKTDIAVWRGAEGLWYILRSGTSAPDVTAWGTSAAPYHDTAAPGDYDGDGQTDVTVWRAADNTWYVKHSRDGAVRALPLGQQGDKPVLTRAQ